jgi:hypothetical protein
VQNGITTTGLKTPYKIKFSKSEGDFILKSKDIKEKLKIQVEDTYGSLKAEWVILIFTIAN